MIHVNPAKPGPKKGRSTYCLGQAGEPRRAAMNPFVEQHRDDVECVLSCFDRVVLTGTFPDIRHPTAMAGYLGTATSACLTVPSGPSRCANRSAPTPSGWLRGLALRSNSSASSAAASRVSSATTSRPASRTRIRHHMGSASIKSDDKAGIMVRVERTANDVSFFNHHRHVEQRNGQTVLKPLHCANRSIA